MRELGRPVADAAGDSGAIGDGWLGHPAMAHFEAIRDLFVATGLPPEPDTYGLFWLHVTGADAALSREVERLLADGALDQEAVVAVRRAHLGEIAAAELHQLVESAQASAERLNARLESGLADLAAYDAAVARGDHAIAVSRSMAELAGVIEDLRRANATMLAANRRLEADIADARLETGRLLERLTAAERVARTDPLTGLLNRRGIAEALKRAMTADGPLAVGLVDIDHFKRFNDQWGHAIGDEVLRCVGGHLGHCAARLGKGAVAGRHGGEEFLMVMPGLLLQQAAAAVDQARAQLARQVIRRATDGASLGHISFSAGVAARRPADCADGLVDRADAALFAAKRAGRDRVLPELPERP